FPQSSIALAMGSGMSGKAVNVAVIGAGVVGASFLDQIVDHEDKHQLQPDPGGRGQPEPDPRVSD
ncbi:hypothetical protein, partial [Serratia marcescens]|uniref:hypothetical protein n=1 Tax=Serratia marcescens TaxID=615 RepID=UPI001952E27B